MFEVRLRPEPSPPAHVQVELVLHRGLDARGSWSLSRAAASQIKGAIDARDDRGAVAFERRDEAERALYRAAREPEGTLTVRYDVAAEVPAVPTPPPVSLDPDRFEARGDALLMLPDALAKKSAGIRVTVDASALGANGSARGASSFGFGQDETLADARELDGALFVAGPMGQARLDGPEGHDDAVWLGYTTFDPRPAVADLAGVRTAVRQILKESGNSPSTLLFLSDSRRAGTFVASRHTRSVALRIGVGEPWSGPVRIAVATAMVREWIGERLWIGPTDPAHEAEAYWFTEGFTRAFARDLLFRFGLVTSPELASEVEGATAIVATSPRRASSNAELAAHAHEAGAVPLLVARGALYATRLAALIHTKSKGTRSLDDLLATLYATARTARGPLPVDAFLAAMDPVVSGKERATFAATILQGALPELPDDALGPCFRRVSRTYAAFELGFDEAAATKDHALSTLDPKGPGARAGLRATDKLVAVQGSEARRSDVRVEVVVDRDGAQKSFKYLPAGATAKGPGWERKRDVAEDACVRH